MNRNILRRAEVYKKSHTKKSWLYRGLSVVAAVAVFCTTYALILPAITLEGEAHNHDDSCYQYTTEVRSLVCTPEVHTHEADCYDEDGELVCGYADYLVHTHDDNCYTDEGELICELPEITEHIHDINCRTVVEDTFEHVHNEYCYETVSELVCGIDLNHVHTEECESIVPGVLTCLEGQESESTSTETDEYTDDFYEDTVSDDFEDVAQEPAEEFEIDETDEPKHEHGPECWSEDTIEYICGNDSDHVHDESCYKTETVMTCDTEVNESEVNETGEALEMLTCDNDEIIVHVHTEECLDGDVLICGLLETYAHQHTDECFETTLVELDEPVLICEEGYVRTAEDLANDFAERVNEIPDTTDENYSYCYMLAYDAFAQATELYFTENPDADNDAFYAWLDELGYSEVLAMFMELPDPDSVELYPDNTLETFSGVNVPGVNIRLYNYDKNIYNGVENIVDVKVYSDFKKSYSLGQWFEFFHNAENKALSVTAVDGKRNQSAYLRWGDPDNYQYSYIFSNYRNEVDDTLHNGYPHINDFSRNYARRGQPVNFNGGSLAYLFPTEEEYDPIMYNYISDAYYMENGGGLFQKDENGNYYYDSKLNAAFYDNDEGKFVLGDWIVRPSYININTTNAVEGGNFLPFNSTNDVNTSIGGTIGGRTAYSLNRVDLWFGMTVDFNFYMPKDGKVNNQDMKFEFHGDDDVFVYIDDVLILNIGGVHVAQSGTINFATGAVYDPVREDTTLYRLYLDAGKIDERGYSTDGTNKQIFRQVDENWIFTDYTSHKFNFFYLERGGNVSYCKLFYNLPTLPENSLIVEKEVTVDAVYTLQEALKDTLEYKFRVLEVTEGDGETTYNPVLGNIGYTLMQYDATKDEYVEVTGTHLTDAYGIFTLKHGQRAVFEELVDKLGEGTFVVEELIPTDLAAQYKAVHSDGNEVDIVAGETTYVDEFGNTYKSYISDEFVIDQEDSSKVGISYLKHFENKVNADYLGNLEIEKVCGNTTDEFTMKVKLGGVYIPVGTKYYIETAEKAVETAGEIKLKAGETAQIRHIIAGTEYSVEEILTTDQDGIYDVTYSGTVTETGGTSTAITYDAAPIVGTLPMKSTVHITVTNSETEITAEIPLAKNTYGLNLEDDGTVTFAFVKTECDEDGVALEGAASTNTTLEVDNETETDKIGFGYGTSTLTAGSKYYLIREASTEGYICDDVVYLVKVDIANVGGLWTATPSIIGTVTTIVDEDGKTTTDVREFDTAPDTLTFNNYRAVSLTVSKTVPTGDKEQDFDFTVSAELNGDDYTLADIATGNITMTNGEFSLSDGDSITISVPYNAVVTVTEAQANGYMTTYAVTEDEVLTASGNGLSVIISHTNDDGSITGITDDTVVEFTNTAGTELPSTGGSGTFLYTFGGLLLCGIAGTLIMYKRRRHSA